MAYFRRRYYIWLLRAYIKRWKKIILTSLLLGVVLFFVILIFFQSLILPKFQGKVEKIGMSGAYQFETLPSEILSEISYGLTSIDEKGQIKGAAADRWEIEDKGKKYIFHLKKGQKYQNGQKFDANHLALHFKDVMKHKIDDYTISYELKNQYSPFLATVSKPIFIDGLYGLGQFTIKRIDVNAGFVQYITLEHKDNKKIKKIFHFYPTQEALKTAYTLGEVDKAVGLSNLKMKRTSFQSWKNTRVTKSVNYKKLVTLFYNNSDTYLSNKKLRQALHFAIYSTFAEGERAYSCILPTSVYFNKIENYSIYDIEIAKTLLSSSNIDGKITIEISTTQEYGKAALTIKDAWSKIGVETKIKIVEDIPSSFQALLYSFSIPKDPDQYTLWHSEQTNNISRYKNLRIDKLLEDGRTTSNTNERVKIYRDFQKYMLDDTPASFLYFPYEYIIERSS